MRNSTTKYITVDDHRHGGISNSHLLGAMRYLCVPLLFYVQYAHKVLNTLSVGTAHLFKVCHLMSHDEVSCVCLVAETWNRLSVENVYYANCLKFLNTVLIYAIYVWNATTVEYVSFICSSNFIYLVSCTRELNVCAM